MKKHGILKLFSKDYRNSRKTWLNGFITGVLGTGVGVTAPNGKELLSVFMNNKTTPNGAVSVNAGQNVRDSRLTHNCGASFDKSTENATIKKFRYVAGSSFSSLVFDNADFIAWCLAICNLNDNNLKSEFNKTAVGNTFEYSWSSPAKGASFTRAKSLDLYVAIKDHTLTINQIKYKFLKISNNSFESTEIHVQANIFDLYDFDYSAPAITIPVLGQYDLAKNAAILQIGAVRGVDQVGKIFQVECIIDKIESPLKWQELTSDEYGGTATITRKSPYYIQKTY